MTTRPTFPDLNNGAQAWDADFNDVKDGLVEKPLPIHEHTGDESDVETSFPAASYGNCLVWVNHTAMGWTLYATDANLQWRPLANTFRAERKNLTGADTLEIWENIVFCAGTPPYTVTLPTAAAAEGLTFNIKTTVAGTVTVDASGSETIDGAANFQLTVQYQSVTLYSDGTTWHVL